MNTGRIQDKLRDRARLSVWWDQYGLEAADTIDQLEKEIEILKADGEFGAGCHRAAGGAPQTLHGELAALLNRRSRENTSNTPDWILAQYLAAALLALNREQDLLKDRLGKAETALAYLRSMTRTQQLEVIGVDARRYRWLTRESVAGQDALYVATDDVTQSLRPEDVDAAIDRKLARNVP